MPITYELNPDKRLLILSHVGAVSDNEFLSFYKALYEDTRFDKSFNVFVDLRQTESYERSTLALQDCADFMQQKFVNTTARPKVAVVAPGDVSFGLARMYEAYSDAGPWEFQVFRSAETALAWLGLAENLVDELYRDANP